MSKTKERWVEMDGSVFTEKEYKIVFPENKERVVFNRRSIAFNVGKETARHIVEVHNASLA